MKPIPMKPPRNPLLGDISYLRDEPLDYLHQLALDYGEIVSFKVATVTAHMINNPDLIQEALVNHSKTLVRSEYSMGIMAEALGHGLLAQEGEHHLMRRKMVQPAFHTTRIQSYADTMVAMTERLLNRWQDAATLDIHEEMMLVTMNIVAKALFDADVEEDARLVGTAIEHLQEITYHDVTRGFRLPSWLPTRYNRQRKQAAATLDQVVLRFIEERRAEGSPDKGDFLSMLMLSEDERGNRMTDAEVRDEAVTLFAAGHETTSNTLTWTLYLLAQHPDAEAKLHAEVDRVLAGRAPTLDDLKQLPYTKQIIQESMRIYPAVWNLFARFATEDTVLGEYRINKGEAVFIAPYVLHRMPNWWENPETFDPERFAPGTEKDRHRYQYLPFAAGPHVCIGNHFAMMEAQLVLAMIASRYRLELVPGYDVAFSAKVTLMPAKGLPMIAHEREAISQRQTPAH